MRPYGIPILLAVVALSSCGGGGVESGNGPSPTASVSHYNGTASVGDFITISVDEIAHTITYDNLTNGEQGTVSYTVDANGMYQINDPAGNLLSAYEIPGYAMVIQAANAGPNRDTAALISAVDAGPIALSTFKGQAYNYMQFRTAAGGVEIGSISVDNSAGASISGYWPFGSLTATNGGQSAFNANQFSLATAVADPSGTYLRLPNGSETDYVFGTANGQFLVDTPNGAIFGLEKAASKDFSAATAGTYHAIYYSKTQASTGAGNIETGTPALGSATVTVSASGAVTITDAGGATMASGTLTAVADTPYLFGVAGQLADPCYGMFTFRTTTAGVQQDVFVTFLGKSAVFSSFSAAQPSFAGETYDYFYGVGLTP